MDLQRRRQPEVDPAMTRRALISCFGLLCLVGAAAFWPVSTASAASGPSVDFSSTLGAPAYHASGTLYGMAENGANPPDHFYTDIRWHLERAGGAQLDSPGGWVAGKYPRRWNATLAQARRTAALGGRFVILPHDLWGADGYPITTWPGDNGNWTSFDSFYNQLTADVQSNGVTVEWDIWNEPDLSVFWKPSQQQYLAMWARAYRRIRAAFPNAVIVGPSTASQPSSGNGWWATFLDYVKANNVVPDIFSWHSLPGDPVANRAAADALLAQHGIPGHPYQINEYASRSEQTPGGGGWYISRLERADTDGLRANWASGAGLHDDAASLLTHSGTRYQALGEWYMYQFYGSMTGTRVSVIPSGNLDAVATRDSGNAKVLLGNHGDTGSIAVTLNRLDSTNLVSNGQIRAVLQRVPYNGGAAVSGPVTVSDQNLAVNNNTATLTLNWTDARDGYTVTLLPPGGGPGPSPTTTPPQPAGGRQIVGGQSGRCLDVPNSATTNGTQLQLWDCGGSAGQRWTATASRQLTVYNGSKCLDASGAGTANGTKVIIWDCNGQPNQQWNLNANGTITGVQSGLCLDATGAATANGTLVVGWSCNGGTNQQWSLRN
ncbi:ricin-type beta-trefoil lectin domain protein [Planosporangium sp. 12N6]|uniref:ricin-type beta-trefoil lectin domain protein n=1 Tax=Planosporangium spinosum TaxID=3402278 RepID=UPI003CF9D43F